MRLLILSALVGVCASIGHANGLQPEDCAKYGDAPFESGVRVCESFTMKACTGHCTSAPYDMCDDRHLYELAGDVYLMTWNQQAWPTRPDNIFPASFGDTGAKKLETEDQWRLLKCKKEGTCKCVWKVYPHGGQYYDCDNEAPYKVGHKVPTMGSEDCDDDYDWFEEQEEEEEEDPV